MPIVETDDVPEQAYHIMLGGMEPLPGREYVAPETLGQLDKALGDQANKPCGACVRKTLNHKALQRHALQHIYCDFCGCGFGHLPRDLTTKHQHHYCRLLQPVTTIDRLQLYLVDEDGVETFAHVRGLTDVPPFPLSSSELELDGTAAPFPSKCWHGV